MGHRLAAAAILRAADNFEDEHQLVQAIFVATHSLDRDELEQVIDHLAGAVVQMSGQLDLGVLEHLAQCLTDAPEGRLPWAPPPKPQPRNRWSQ